MKTSKLTNEEKAIEQNIDDLIPVEGDKKEKIEKILRNARKNKSISLRISSFILDNLKEKAGKIGIPYQTLINSILHKYVTNQLLDEDEVIKALSIKKNLDLN